MDLPPPITRIIIIIRKNYYSLADIMSQSPLSPRPNNFIIRKHFIDKVFHKFYILTSVKSYVING